MKIWFDNEGTAFGGKKYFAVIEEFLVDKDGTPVITAQESDTAAENTNTQINGENAELIAKVDKIIEDVSARNVSVEKTVDSSETVTETTTAKTESEVVNETVNEVTNETVNEVTNETVSESASEHNVEHNIEHNVIHNIEHNVETEVASAAEETPAEEAVAEETNAEEAVSVEPEAVEPVEEAAAEEAVAEETVNADDVFAADEVENDVFDESQGAEPENGGIDINVAAIDLSGEAAQPEQTHGADSSVNVAIAAGSAVAAGASGEVKTVVRSRNFAEKMRDADEVMQDRYDELKNYALRFRKLKARISKKFDSINAGRFQFVKLSIAGKTLKLYLNMDINTTDPKYHCKDMSDKKTYVTVPVLLRIKSGRAVKYAKRLIDQCAEQHGMLERRKPFVVDSMALIEEALAAKEGRNADDVDEELDDVALTADENETAEE